VSGGLSNCIISSLNLPFNILPFVKSSCNSGLELARTLEYLT
jgi:hypothetical protein